MVGAAAQGSGQIQCQTWAQPQESGHAMDMPWPAMPWPPWPPYHGEPLRGSSPTEGPVTLNFLTSLAAIALLPSQMSDLPVSLLGQTWLTVLTSCLECRNYPLHLLCLATFPTSRTRGQGEQLAYSLNGGCLSLNLYESECTPHTPTRP